MFLSLNDIHFILFASAIAGLQAFHSMPSQQNQFNLNLETVKCKVQKEISAESETGKAEANARVDITTI
jgi:hypothetical protein